MHNNFRHGTKCFDFKEKVHELIKFGNRCHKFCSGRVCLYIAKLSAVTQSTNSKPMLYKNVQTSNKNTHKLNKIDSYSLDTSAAQKHCHPSLEDHEVKYDL